MLSRGKVDHLGTELFRQGNNQFVFTVGLTGVTDQAAEAHLADLAYLTIPLEILLAAYIAIISPEQTM